MQIEAIVDRLNARPRLLAVLATAKGDPELLRTLQSPEGQIEMMGMWVHAVSVDSVPR